MKLSHKHLISSHVLLVILIQLTACVNQREDLGKNQSTNDDSKVFDPKSAKQEHGQVSASSTTAVLSKDELLELAFQIGSSIPVQPHTRDRARMQALVVQACIDNGSLVEAFQYASQIDGWRQGEMIALIGQKYLANNDAENARAFAKKALEKSGNEIDWRKERIQTEIAKIYIQLGDTSQAYQLMSGARQEELGKMEVERTINMLPEELDIQADMFDKAIATHNFDFVRNAIEGYLAWFDRVASDDARTARASKAIDDAIRGLPYDLQIQYKIDFADHLFQSGKTEQAVLNLNNANEILSKTTFLPQDVSPLGAMIARAYVRLGDPKSARFLLQRLHAEYPTRREGITNLRRATSLRALAEGFCEIGDRDDAIACYTTALEEGAINPNARPRAEDLCATCVSMAKYKILLTPELTKRIALLRNSLTDPW